MSYSREDFIRDIEADFINARKQVGQKKKIRELMDKYGETREEIENNSTMAEWMEFKLANGDALLDEVREERERERMLVQPSRQKTEESLSRQKSDLEPMETEEEEEEEEIEEKKELKPFRTNIDTGKDSSVVKEAEQALKDDKQRINRTMGNQFGILRSYKNSNYQLGTLSAAYETGGDPLKIGNDEAGGYSYGRYQIATKTGTMQSYINYLNRIPEYKSYAEILNNAGGVVAAKQKKQSFVNAWRKLSQNSDFNKSQFQFIIETHLTPLLKKVTENDILDIENRHPVVKDVLYSMSVQHYGASQIVNRALLALKERYKENTKNIGDAAIIKELYNQRSIYVLSLPESKKKGDGKITKKDKDTIVKNRYPRELKDALKYLKR